MTRAPLAPLQNSVKLAARRAGAVHHRDPGDHEEHETRDEQSDFVLWKHLAHAGSLTPTGPAVTARAAAK